MPYEKPDSDTLGGELVRDDVESKTLEARAFDPLDAWAARLARDSCDIGERDAEAYWGGKIRMLRGGGMRPETTKGDSDGRD